MSYAAAIDHLNSLVPELASTPGQPRRKFSLDQIALLCATLGQPHLQFPSVLIAGTNGKGSTAATLASILATSGLRVGLYTSPHLHRVNERIRLALPATSATPAPFAEIPDETFAHLYFHVLHHAQQLVASAQLPTLPSFFELLTAVAFCDFAESHVQIAVLEVGMGGRLDATNLVHPILSVITDIALDHTEWLGPTITAIANEKAGILRANGTLITLPQHPEANQALGEVAVQLNVRAINAADYTPPIGTTPFEPYCLQIPLLTSPSTSITVNSPLKGTHQHRNLALAIATAIELAQHHGFPISPQSIEQGIRTTQWPGRMELLQLQNPAGPAEVLLDVAHNPAGAWALRSALSTLLNDQPRPLTLVFGCLRDKAIDEIIQILFPLFDHVILAPIHNPRAAALADLEAAAARTGTIHQSAPSIQSALNLAAQQSRPVPQNQQKALVVVSGSVYLVGAARAHLLQSGYQPQTLFSQGIQA